MAITLSSNINLLGTENRTVTNRVKYGGQGSSAMVEAPVRLRVGNTPSGSSDATSLVLDPRTTSIIVHSNPVSGTAYTNLNIRVSSIDTVGLNHNLAGTGTTVIPYRLPVPQGATVTITYSGGTTAIATLSVLEFGVRPLQSGTFA